MSNKNTNQLVPKLRFPDFRDAGEWKVKKLGECLDYIQPTKYLVKSTAYNDSYKTPVLTAGKTFVLGYTDESQDIFSDKLPVIIFDDFTTATKFVDFSFKAKSSAMKILLAKKDTNIKFIFEAMQMIKYEIGVHKRHWISKFSMLNIAIPSPLEQQKIADCLSSLDELITTQAQKIDTLKAHKKGLMQKLFPAEGKTVPRLRFPEFRDAGEWKEKTIDNSCITFSGGTPKTSNKQFYNGNISFIRSAEIDKAITELHLTNEGLINSSAKMVQKGDLLVALYGANSGEVALSKIEGAINQAILCLRHETNNAFVYQYLSHKKNWIISTYIQGGQGNLSGEIIKSIKLYFPNPTDPSDSIEQQKIADCLSSLDELITTQVQKIDTLKEHKKGLMQGLFLSSDEVSV